MLLQSYVYMLVQGLMRVEVRNGEGMDELLVKGKDNILMLIQALDKEQNSHANNGCGARKSAVSLGILRKLVRPGAWSCLAGGKDLWRGLLLTA